MNSSTPAEIGNGSSYATADPGKLTLNPSFFASSAKQQTETVAHESTHHGLGTNDNPLYTGAGSPALRPYGQTNVSRMATMVQDPFYMLNKADAVTLSLGFTRDDNW